MKGVIYTRVSSDEQVEGTSLTSQEEMCRRYCSQHDIYVVEVFREEGQSAKDLSLQNRSQFLAAIELCHKRKDITAFVVLRVDRFARNAHDHFSVRRLLSSYGTTLRSVTETIGDRPAEKFIETVLAGASEYDNAIRKQRCTDGMLARLQQGIWPFKPPIGYVCARHRSRGEKKTQPDDLDAQLAPILQRALRAYANGNILSQAGLARQLNLWAFNTFTGKSATPQLVDRLLNKYLEFYAGILVNPWTGEHTPGRHEPLITRAEYEAIANRKRGTRSSPLKRHYFNGAFPLRRLLKCAGCGSLLTGGRSRGNGGVYAYYYCINKACDRRFRVLRGAELHARFPEFMKRLSTHPKDRIDVEGRAIALLRSHGDTAAAATSETAKQRAELLARRERILELREDGSYDRETFRTRLAAVDAALEQAGPVSADTASLSRLDENELRRSVRWFVDYLVHVWDGLQQLNPLRFERIAFPDGFSYSRRSGFRTSQPGLVLALFHSPLTRSSAKVDLGSLSSNQVHEYFKELIAFHREIEAAIDRGEIILPRETAA